MPIENGKAVPRAGIPHLAFDEFQRQALDIVGSGGKVVQHFAYPEDGGIKLLAVLRTTDRLLAAGCDAPDSYPP